MALGRLRNAADALAHAYDNAISHTHPPIRRAGGGRRARAGVSVAWYGVDVDDPARRARKEADAGRQDLERAVDGLTRWVLPLAVGESPATLAFLAETLGAPANEDRGGHAARVLRANAEPAPAEVRRASSIVARIVLRLSVTGALRPGRHDDKLLELWAQDVARMEQSE